MKAASSHTSVSEVVNEAARITLREDQEDLSAFEQRTGSSKGRGHPLEIPGQAGKANSFGFFQPNHFSP